MCTLVTLPSFLLTRSGSNPNQEATVKVAIYARISTPDQHLESQLYPLRELAQRRGYHVVQ